MEAKKRGRPVGTTGAYKEVTKKMYSFRLSEKEVKAVRKLLAKMRNKLVILFFILMMLIIPANATTLTGGVEYTEETARQEAFEWVSQYLTFPNKESYRRTRFLLSIDNNAKKILEYKARILILPFKFYGVVYDNEPNKTYIYSKNYKGYQCQCIVVYSDIEKYPIKVANYDAQTGKLLSVGLLTEDGEEYKYDLNGKLFGHWRDYKFKTPDKRISLYISRILNDSP